MSYKIIVVSLNKYLLYLQTLSFVYCYIYCILYCILGFQKPKKCPLIGISRRMHWGAAGSDFEQHTILIYFKNLKYTSIRPCSCIFSQIFFMRYKFSNSEILMRCQKKKFKPQDLKNSLIHNVL